MIMRTRMLLLSLLLLLLTAAAIADNDSGVDTNDVNSHSRKKDAMMRLLTASLSNPNADIASIRRDAKQVFGEIILQEDELEELLANAVKSTAAATDAADGVTPSSCKNIDETTAIKEDTITITTTTTSAADSDNIPLHADRIVKRVNAVRNDFDCMEREFDMASPAFNATQAAHVLDKCRLLVVRNIWDSSLISDYKIRFSNYLSALHEGRLSKKGTTTLGEAGFWVKRNTKRFDIILPEYLTNDKIYANRKVKKIMSKALGDEFIINSIGAVIAERGAPMGSYHYDDAYLMGDDSFHELHLAGTDLPPWAVTMFFPVSNVTLEQGPTEFCMGTNHFKGLRKKDMANMRDETLVGPDTDFAKLQRFEKTNKQCPDEFTRTPLLNAGDAIFFDYTITHRGGANTSPDLRAMQYVFYSRYWYRDSNFEVESLPGFSTKNMTDNELKTQTTRFALLEGKTTECNDPPCAERIPLESISNFMDASHQKIMVQVTIQNIDFKGASLYVGKNGSKFLTNVPVGDSITVTLKVGSKLRLTRVDDDEDEDWISTWKLKRNQDKIVLETQQLLPLEETE